MGKYMLPCYVVTERKSKIYDFFYDWKTGHNGHK
jgi:hypothetical protein